MSTTAAEFSRWEYRNIALAAVTQCASLVHRLASQGSVPAASLRSCLVPVYDMDPASLDALYPDVRRFSEGIDILQRSFDSEGLRDNAEVVRYLFGMLMLQQHLGRRDDMQQQIRERLQALQRRGITPLSSDTPAGSDETVMHYEVDAAVATTADWHDESAVQKPDELQESCNALARLYQDTISKLSFRIHVAGNPEYLRDHAVADQIRALLLAGIRSAVLWHQLGGRRWHLFFYKKRYRETLVGIRRKLLTL